MVNTPRPLLDVLRDLEDNSEQRQQLRREVGKAFYAARLQRGLTQTMLADALGTTQSYVSQVEHGDKTPSEDFLAAAANVLHPKGASHASDQAQEVRRKKRRK